MKRKQNDNNHIKHDTNQRDICGWWGHDRRLCCSSLAVGEDTQGEGGEIVSGVSKQITMQKLHSKTVNRLRQRILSYAIIAS